MAAVNGSTVKSKIFKTDIPFDKASKDRSNILHISGPKKTWKYQAKSNEDLKKISMPFHEPTRNNVQFMSQAVPPGPVPPPVQSKPLQRSRTVPSPPPLPPLQRQISVPFSPSVQRQMSAPLHTRTRGSQRLQQVHQLHQGLAARVEFASQKRKPAANNDQPYQMFYLNGPQKGPPPYNGPPVNSGPPQFNGLPVNRGPPPYNGPPVNNQDKLDVRNAGEGNLEISVLGNDRNLQNHVRNIAPGKFEVSYTPLENGSHTANVTFNEQHVPGSPYPFQVMDIALVEVYGDGLSMVSVGKPANFTVLAPGARQTDLNIKIMSGSGHAVTPAVREQSGGHFLVEYMPMDAGDHMVHVNYMNQSIKGSPFTARAWDAAKVKVMGIAPGRINKPSVFTIDASRAGAGNLEIIVSVGGENVPNFVTSLGSAKYQVSFTPQIPDTHIISVKFNGEVVPESPFYCAVVDGSKVTASGDGLNQVMLNKPATFSVYTNGVGESTLDVSITSPNGRNVPAKVVGNPANGYQVAYTPGEVGAHRISVHYADIDIQGSPFIVQAFDATLVRVGKILDGLVHQPVHFDVDCSMAGEGTLTVNIRGPTSSVIPTITSKGNGIFDVMFNPTENSYHTIDVTFNGETIPGSPFRSNVYDFSSLSISWDAMLALPVNRPASFDIELGNSSNAVLEVVVTDPMGKSIPATIKTLGTRKMIEFTPYMVGPHIITGAVQGQLLPGCPHTAQVFDAMRVIIEDVSKMGRVGKEMEFTVNTVEAGQGDLDVEVTCGGQPVRPQVHRIDGFRYRFSFTPDTPREHNVKINFNYVEVPGSPLRLQVVDPYNSLSLVPSEECLAVNAIGRNLIRTLRTPIDISDMAIVINAPNHELVPAKMVQQPDGDYKVEYSSKYTGRHKVEILYAGQAIMGSPFYVEIYDPNKIRVDGPKTGMVEQPLSFEVLTSDAGKAELGLTITSPSGRQVPYENQPTSHGHRITYVPHEFGTHQIFITYGGLEVPGCPLPHHIQDTGTVKCLGDGLIRGEEDKPTTFYVDSEGRNGELAIQVDGPNSIAKCRVTPDGTGKHVVTYTPVETGVFNIQVKWNGREVPGSPWRASVIDVRKVHVVGGWQTLLDANNVMRLAVNEPKRVQFDVSEAGQGQLTTEVRGPDGGQVHCDCHMASGGQIWTVQFTPVMEGDHRLHVRYADVPLPRSPLHGVTMGGEVRMTQVTGTMTQSHEKVILTGRGLEQARVKEAAEFVIDGTDAGEGTPYVQLTGVKANIDVQITSLGGNKFRCVYVPEIPGAYLLNITWADRQVRGSPFKVNVTSHSDATKVVCTGEGLKMGIMGQEIKSVIDTRRAGPGELIAHCVGPTKEAYCELFDHRDGTFTLNVQPQEAGRHTLYIKYDGEHVPGSPHTLRVTGAPDASKVRVYGPGVENGILASYQSRFIVDTRGAGAGQLTVRIRGPKGAFRVEMQRESQKDRTILCRYDPTEVGLYVIHVRWSDKHVTGSPFHVHIFDTQQELERYTQEAQQITNGHNGFQATNGFQAYSSGDSTLGNQSNRLGDATMNFNTWQR